MKRFGFVLAVTLVAGCAGDGPLGVSTSDGSLRMANSSPVPVYYFLMESEFATRANWAPCNNPATCPQVAPHRDKRVAYEEIAGYEPGDATAILYWWHLVPGPAGGHRPDSIRAIGIQLRRLP